MMLIKVYHFLLHYLAEQVVFQDPNHLTMEYEYKLKHNYENVMTRHILSRCVCDLVCPTKESTRVSWWLSWGASVSAHMPLMPGRSMEACSWMPMPLRIIRREPILNAPGEGRNNSFQREKRLSHSISHFITFNQYITLFSCLFNSRMPSPV